jgi:hypothetical protein
VPLVDVDLEKYLKVMRSLEWMSGSLAHRCPYCRGFKSVGHAPKCELAEVIQAASEALASVTHS